MTAPARLHHIGLRRPRRHAGRGAAAHDVDDHAGNFGTRRVADVFLLEGKSRTAGRGHRLDAAHGGADHGRHRGDLVFHLHKNAADLRQPAGQTFRDLRRRGNRIAGEEAAAGGDRTERTGAVARNQLRGAFAGQRGINGVHRAAPPSETALARSRCTRIAKSGHSHSHRRQPVHLSGSASSTMRSAFSRRHRSGQSFTQMSQLLHQAGVISRRTR